SEYKRGEVILFYPPASEPGLKRLHFDWLHIMGNLTGLPIFHRQPVFIKRVIAVAGETVEVKPGEGVFVNGRLLPEPYVAEPASYRLKELADLGGENALGATIQPHAGQKKAIVVPPGTCFVLGDNRNQSADSHVFGFVPTASIMGRAVVRFYPDIKDLSPPEYK
ncbi:MAG TPA: signal peptidase I, partial [Candidatus Obscuribacter sp.]|nr:signal peptidase I [Candidatus Obscuribacter sp.]